MNYVKDVYICWKALPVQNKIVNFMFYKSVGTGLYLGIKNYNALDQPAATAQLFYTVIKYSLSGVFQAALWEITFTHFVVENLDKIALEIMNKPNNNNPTN